MPRRAAVVVIGLSGLGLLLTGCHLPGGAVHREVLVEFVTANSSAAKPVVIATCGHLPGVSVDPSVSGDPNVHLNVTHTSTQQLAAVTYCVAQLQAAKPALQIRDYRIDDGIGS